MREVSGDEKQRAKADQRLGGEVGLKEFGVQEMGYLVRIPELCPSLAEHYRGLSSLCYLEFPCSSLLKVSQK